MNTRKVWNCQYHSNKNILKRRINLHDTSGQTASTHYCKIKFWNNIFYSPLHLWNRVKLQTENSWGGKFRWGNQSQHTAHHNITILVLMGINGGKTFTLIFQTWKTFLLTVLKSWKSRKIQIVDKIDQPAFIAHNSKKEI